MICSCTKVGAKVSGSLAPEELDAIDFGDNVIIPDDKKKDAFPIPWGFLVSFQAKFTVRSGQVLLQNNS